MHPRRLSLMLLTAAMFLAPTVVLAGGTLKATVTFEGDRPKRTVVKMDADQFCATANKKKVGSQNAIVSKSGLVKNAVIYVKDGLGDAKFDAPAEKANLDQRGCMYQPHVQSVQVDQEVEILNSDDTLHNIHSFAKKQRAFNFAQPKKGMVKTVTFKRSEFVKVKCDVHPWMSAFVAVFEHPFHAVTGKKGVCEIADLPAGEYTLGAWHEEFGEQEIKVSVGDGETKDVAFVFPAK